MNIHELKNEYTLWYHNQNDTNWSQDSYHQILTFTNLQEFWILDYYIGQQMIEDGMFFVMKGDVLPIWETNDNKDGGYISWKVDKKNSYTYWIETIGHMVTNSFELNESINGISISPKKNFNIIKLWFKTPIDLDKYKLPDEFKLNKFDNIFKLHQVYLEKEKKLKTQKNID